MFRCTLTISVFLVLIAAESAPAQVPRYSPPAGPTLPNYLNYFRADVGVLDPYNAFVAPTQRLSRQLQAMSQQEYSDVTRSRQQIEQLRQTLAAPTGVGATFMNYSHYYPLASGPSAGPARRSAPVLPRSR